MSDDIRNGASTGEPPEASKREASSLQPQNRELLPLPGLAGIALYMLVLAGVSILGVANGQFRPVYLVFSAFFITAALGLLLLFRWAWALTLAAVVLLVTVFTWRFTTEHQFPFLVQGLLNMVFFLYLIRTAVRSKLR
jgi:lysylphosphatidylglycerol synthetase-like protein (DUF2156 family)